MILNVYTVVALFLAATGFVLAAVGTIVAARTLFALRHRADADISALDAFEDRAHLIALILGVLAAVRLLAWPFFYALLESYVPELAVYGVMCAFGVTLIEAPLVSAVQWLKPVVLFGLGFWGLLAAVDRRAGTAVLLPTRVALAVPLALVALTDCVVEVVYLVREKVGHPVTCCTRFRDTEVASLADNVSPLPMLGSTTATTSLGALFVLGVVLVVLAAWFARRTRAPAFWPAAVVALLGAANLMVTQWSWIDAVAPRVLGLPYHHCPYELLTGTPALGLAAFLAVVGSAGLIWAAALALWRRSAPEAVSSVQRRIYSFCALALASELLIVGVHVV